MNRPARHLAVWLALALLAACGGNDGAESTATPQKTPAAEELPRSMSRSELSRLEEELEELPLRVIPRLPESERLSFDTTAAASDEFIDAIADGDFDAADRVMASVAQPMRKELLAAAENVGHEYWDAGDYARSYRFSRYQHLDHSKLWDLDQPDAAAASADDPGLTLQGRIVDATSGEPLSNMTLVVAPEGHNSFDILMKSFGYTTGSDGRFKIEGLPVNTVGIHAQGVHGGKVYFLSEETITFADGVDQVIKMEGRRGKLNVPVVVVGFVRDRTTGEAIANARVSAGGWKAERTGPEGRFLIQLDPGKDWQLTADHEAYHESAAQAFSSPTPKKFETEFLLDPITTGTILGTAINSITGEPIANAVIEIAGRQVRTDSLGRFRAEEVESGEVTVSGGQSGYRSDAEALVLEALQTAEATLHLEPITTGTIRGVVVDAASGEPLADAAVRAGEEQVVTGADGRFVLENVEAGTLEVAASKAVYVPNAEAVALEAMAEIETEIELTPITWGSVTGVVRDADSGALLRDATVRIGGMEVSADANGEYRAERVPAGSVSATASLARYREGRADLELPRDGEVRQDFSLAPITTGTVAGIVRDAKTGQAIGNATITIGSLGVRTASDGRFTIADVPAGKLTVRAVADVYESGTAELLLEAATEAQTEFALDPITYGTVRGTVTDASSGAPLVNADVRIGGLAVRTNRNGEYTAGRVPAGEVSVTAERRRYRSAQQSAQLARAGELELDFSLEPITTGTVSGIVRDAATGRPLLGVEVLAGSQAATSGVDGSFVIENVPAGETELRASAKLYESAQQRIAIEAAETVTTELELQPVTYGSIAGRVIEAGTGKPLADADVRAGTRSGRTDGEGRFSLERVAAGSVSVAASKPVYVDGSKTIELAAGENVRLELELEAITWGSVRGVVRDAESGKPLADVEVTVGSTAIRSDTSGRFSAERVKAGTVQIAAKLAAYEPAAQGIELPAAEERDVTLQLKPIRIGDIDGQVIDAKTGEPVAGARVTVGSRAAETDPAGRFRFDGVDTGTKTVAARHPDYANGSASARVAPADTVEVVIRLDLRREDVTNLEAELAKSGTIDLYGIYFDSGKSQFKPSSLPTLRAVLEVMKRAPGRRFQIAGHTDADGGDDYNQNLSERRAKSVIDWLVGNGVDAARLDATGYGESQPVAPNDTESGKALNRRVQLSYAR